MQMRRIMTNNEPLKDTVPLIYSERKDGVLPAHNIRTDRWDIAYQTTSHVQASAMSKRKGRLEKTDLKIVKNENNEPIQGKDANAPTSNA